MPLVNCKLTGVLPDQAGDDGGVGGGGAYGGGVCAAPGGGHGALLVQPAHGVDAVGASLAKGARIHILEAGTAAFAWNLSKPKCHIIN